MGNFNKQMDLSISWLKKLKDNFYSKFEKIEKSYGSSSIFEFKNCIRNGGNGSKMSSLCGTVFKKVGVKISIVHGELSDELAQKIPGC